MADVIKITDGTTEVPLILDADGMQMIATGNQFGLPEHSHLYHESQWADGREVVRERVENRVWTMKMAIRGDSDDDVADALIQFNRLVRQARRYQMDKSVDRVYLYIKLNSSTYATYYDVVDVKYNSLALLSYMNRSIEELIFDDGFSVEVETKPYGYGDEVTLANELANPGFQEDSDDDGLADLWLDMPLAPSATSINTTTYRVSGQAQSFTTNASGQGIRSYRFDQDLSNNRTFVAYAWVYMTGTGTVTLDALEGLYPAALTSIDADSTTLEDQWVRLEVSGTVVAGTFSQLAITATSGVTVVVDQCYWEFGATTIPVGWMSSRYVKRHKDDDEGDINYIDIADIPGDAPAILNFSSTFLVGDFFGALHMGTKEDSNPFADITLNDADVYQWHVTPVVTLDSDYTGGQYSTTTLPTLSSWVSIARWLTSPLEIGKKYMAILRVAAVPTGIEFRMAENHGIVTPYPPVDGSRWYYEMGIFNGTASIVELQAKTSTGGAVALDSIVFIPIDQYRIIDNTRGLVVSGSGTITDNGYEDTIDINGTATTLHYLQGLGDRIYLEPGKEFRAFFFIYTYEASPTNQTETAVCTIAYRPRTEFILGTT